MSTKYGLYPKCVDTHGVCTYRRVSICPKVCTYSKGYVYPLKYGLCTKCGIYSKMCIAPYSMIMYNMWCVAHGVV